MYSPLVSWSRYVYLAALVGALVFVLPVAWFPFQLGKLALFVTLLLISVILFVIGRGTREFARSHGIMLALLVALLPIMYGVSTLLSINPAVGIKGYGIETDTLLFSLIAALAFLFSFVLFRTLRSVRMLLTVVFWSLVSIAVFQAIVIVFGSTLMPFDMFNDRSTNLVGKWNDLGLMIGLLLIFVLGEAELGHGTPLRKALLGTGGALLALMLGIINFGLVWGFMLAFSIVLALTVFIVQKSSQRRGETEFAPFSNIRFVPWFAISGAVVSLVFIFFGSNINTTLTNVFPVSSLEVRPSYTSTLDVINPSREGSIGKILLGTGPNTFGQHWLAHKPVEVNQSVFWNLDFNVGFSTLMTALSSVGLFGALMWMLPLVLVLAGLVRAIRLEILSREERVAAISAAMGNIFLLMAIILYVPSQNIILLAFTLAGATFAFLWRQGRVAREEGAASRLSHIALGSVSLGLIAVVLWSAFNVDRRFISQAYSGAAVAAVGQGNIEKGLIHLATAERIEKTSDTLRLKVETHSLELQQLAQNTTISQEEAQQRFTALAGAAVDAGQELVAHAPADYRSHLVIAGLYDLLASLKISGAYDSAKQAYAAAFERNPKNPQIPLLMARLEGMQSNIEASEARLTESLTLKPNYTDAILFAVQLSVARNDIQNAIRAATAAVQTAPGVAPIWFQLGLLYYAAGDTMNAALALEQAVAIVPDYANAKYFLGLSYYAQKKTAEAITQFQDLAKTNPDNAEVALVLSNMASGKDPFASSTPPFTPPEDRRTAPIAQ